MLHIQLKLDAIDLIVHIDHSIKLVAIDPAFIAINGLQLQLEESETNLCGL